MHYAPPDFQVVTLSQFRSTQIFIAILVSIASSTGGVNADPDGTQLPTSLQSAHQNTVSIEIDNSQFGEIQFFAGSSKTGTLIGRVLKPATQLTKSKLRNSESEVGINAGHVVVISPSKNEEFRIVSNPEHPALKAPPSTIITDLPKGKGIFNPAIDPEGTTVHLNVLNQLTLLPSNYIPTTGDHIYLVANLTASEELNAVKQLDGLAKQYSAACIQRAHLWHRTIVTGTLKASAILPKGEPDPIAAVQFTVDGDIEDLKNTPPYLFSWDSRIAKNGEHILEIDALDQEGNIITNKRMLVVVDNGENPPPPHSSGALDHAKTSSKSERKSENK